MIFQSVLKMKSITNIEIISLGLTTLSFIPKHIDHC